jgi:hypothetical protein
VVPLYPHHFPEKAVSVKDAGKDAHGKTVYPAGTGWDITNFNQENP